MIDRWALLGSSSKRATGRRLLLLSLRSARTIWPPASPAPKTITRRQLAGSGDRLASTDARYAKRGAMVHTAATNGAKATTLSGTSCGLATRLAVIERGADQQAHPPQHDRFVGRTDHIAHAVDARGVTHDGDQDCGERGESERAIASRVGG